VKVKKKSTSGGSNSGAMKGKRGKTANNLPGAKKRTSVQTHSRGQNWVPESEHKIRSSLTRAWIPNTISSVKPGALGRAIDDVPKISRGGERQNSFSKQFQGPRGMGAPDYQVGGITPIGTPPGFENQEMGQGGMSRKHGGARTVKRE